jgi:demethylmenaquinone methyltransferase/2-methoxy-6-polyprenyl-1,4-benzoquinol methylase
VQAFPDGSDFTRILESVGFTATQCISLTFGICSIYTGRK